MKKQKRAILIVGTTESYPDIRYATGFTAPDPVIFLAASRKKILLVSGLELGRACAVVRRGVRVVTPADIAVTGQQRGRLRGWVLALLRGEGIRAVSVPPSFPVAIADYLRRNSITVSVSEKALFPARQTKASDELKNIGQAQAAACAAMADAIALIRRARVNRRGLLVQDRRILTSEYIRAVIEKTLLDHDCIAPDGTVAACGSAAADPHEAGEGPLAAGETIVLDIFPKHKAHGYWGDLTRTVIKGKPSPMQKKMYLAVRAAQNMALAAIRPGISAATVHRVASEALEKRGFETRRDGDRFVGFIHGTGHGVGLEIHEQPTLGTARTRLKAGNVVTVEPGLYYPELGGVRIEDTVVVTKKGWKYLQKCPKQFEL